MKTILLTILVFGHYAFANDFAEVGLPIITVYNQDKYDAHNQNWDIEQHDNSLIYVANGNGLLEFDGVKWTLYPTPNRSRIREFKIVADKIYVGTTNDIGYYQKNNQGSLVFHSLKQLIDKKHQDFGDIMTVVAIENFIVFKTKDYYFVWNGKTLKTIIDTSKSRMKLIAFEGNIFVKLKNDKNIYRMVFNGDEYLVKTQWQLPLNSKIKQILRDKRGKLIVFTSKNGVFIQKNNQLQKINGLLDSETIIYETIISNDGYFYIATINQGLYIISDELKVVKNYRSFHGLQMNSIYSVLSDEQNNIWISGNKAIAVMRPSNEVSTYAKSDDVYGFELNYSQNKLTYFGNGILQLENSENSENPFYPKQFNKIDGIDYEIWDGIDFGQKTLLATKKGIEIGTIENNKLSHDLIAENNLFNYDFTTTTDFKHIFVATDGGLFHVQQADGIWQSNFVKGMEFGVNSIAIDNNETLWVGTSSPKLYSVDIESIIDKQPIIKRYNQSHGIGNNKVVPFNTKSLGLVFVTNDGVMQLSGDSDKPLKFLDDMPAIFNTKKQDAHLLYDDLDNRLWYRIGSHTGFAYKEDNSWKVDENISKYLPNRSIDSFITNQKNIMWILQSDDGLFRINTEKAINLPMLAPIYIRQILDLNNNTTIDSGIVKELSNNLTHNNNSIRVSYAIADYVLPGKSLYRTKMSGSQSPKWSQWTKETYKDFTELRGNNYTLEVQAKDGFGRITESTKLAFKVLPPFYLSTTALIIYALLALIILTLTAWLVQKWRTKKLQAHNIELASLVDKKTIEIQGHVEELEQQQELKTRFFTNVSHELRTPLSLIILPLQKLIKYNQKSLDTESKELLTLSLKNANGMKQLVNEVLDVSRFEEKSMPIVVQKNDLVGFVENIANHFNQWATQNSQRISLSLPKDKIVLYFDRKMMEKIISNLLTNAIKYSGKETTITLSFFSNDETAGFIVKDNGVGIAKDKCQQVFERYFKEDENNKEYDSSGIGLAFVKEMVELHHGTITLNSDIDCGCEFSLSFKQGHEHFSVFEQQQGQSEQIVNQSHPEDTAVVMIVEDNTDLREFVSKSLSFDYKVIQAINGADALQTLTHELPDLIISDIMMPQMDGIEFLQKLRRQPQFKTIPFFLLSSKSTQSDTQVGLQYGADDYLTKPFDMDELLLRVKNMINSRKLIRTQVQHQLQEIKQQDTVKLTGFEKKVRDIILENISDSHFNVSSLASTMGLERSALFRKTKKELHISPSKYIQQVRLEIAKELLEKESISVSEVAYAAGFESLSYFSKTFKLKFGLAPSAITG